MKNENKIKNLFYLLKKKISILKIFLNIKFLIFFKNYIYIFFIQIFFLWLNYYFFILFAINYKNYIKLINYDLIFNIFFKNLNFLKKKVELINLLFLKYVYFFYNNIIK